MTPYFVALCAALTILDTRTSAANIDASAFQSEKSLTSDARTLASARFREQSSDDDAIKAMIIAIPNLQSLSVDPWVITTGRPAPPQPYYCYFNGVKCTPDGCKKDSYYVSDISLNGLSLSGTIPTQIGHFSKMKSFSISNNVLAGSIPSEIGMWSSVTSLSLDSNSLTGAVPNSITQMTSLVSLNLSSNSFTGSIPDGIGFLTGLTYLSMSDASITGVIPNTIGLFDKMVEFDVSNNKLEGSIPDTICNLTKLKALDLSKNTLSGPIPPLFRQLNMLTNLRISDNYITKFGPVGDANDFFTGYPTRNDDRYCNNCFPIVAVDSFLCFKREGCPYNKSVTPTRQPTIGGTIEEAPVYYLDDPVITDDDAPTFSPSIL